jgi:hypothetical protein
MVVHSKISAARVSNVGDTSRLSATAQPKSPMNSRRCTHLPKNTMFTTITALENGASGIMAAICFKRLVKADGRFDPKDVG